MSPRVSIVVPAYQAEWCIGSAVSSALSQTYPNFELIVVDDGSTDATADIVAAHSGPITLVSQEQSGVASARNRGVTAASGELITFLDADDVLFPGHVEGLVELWDEKGGIVTADFYYLLPGGIDSRRRRYKGRFPPTERQRMAILEQNFVSTMSLFPQSLGEEVGWFDDSRHRAEDWDFWIRAIFAGARVSLRARPSALKRLGTESLSSAWERMDADVLAIIRAVAERDDLTPQERSYVDRRLSGRGPRELSREGDMALRARRYRDAARSYRAAAKLAPSERPLVWKARVMSVAPRLVGPAVRARQVAIEKDLGIDESHTF